MFSLDGPLYRICNFIYKYLVVNLLFLVASIPLVTIPAASAALFCVVRKQVYHEEPPLIRTFGRGFRDNWKQASIVGYLFGFVALIWWLDIRMLLHRTVPLGGVVSIAMLVIAVVLLSMMIHVFPLMVHVHATTRQLLLNSLKLSMVKPLLTLVNLIMLICLFLISMRFTVLFVICYFSISAATTYWLVNRKFERVGASYQQPEDDVPSQE